MLKSAMMSLAALAMLGAPAMGSGGAQVVHPQGTPSRPGQGRRSQQRTQSQEVAHGRRGTNGQTLPSGVSGAKLIRKAARGELGRWMSL